MASSTQMNGGLSVHRTLSNIWFREILRREAAGLRGGILKEAGRTLSRNIELRPAALNSYPWKASSRKNLPAGARAVAAAVCSGRDCHGLSAVSITCTANNWIVNEEFFSREENPEEAEGLKEGNREGVPKKVHKPLLCMAQPPGCQESSSRKKGPLFRSGEIAVSTDRTLLPSIGAVRFEKEYYDLIA